MSLSSFPAGGEGVEGADGADTEGLEPQTGREDDNEGAEAAEGPPRTTEAKGLALAVAGAAKLIPPKTLPPDEEGGFMAFPNDEAPEFPST